MHNSLFFNLKYPKLTNEPNRGVSGSIITGLKYNKKVIAAARLKEYGEHTNNHQLQIIKNFTKERGITNDKILSKIGRKICKSNKYSLYNCLDWTSTKNASIFNKKRLIPGKIKIMP